MTPLWCTQHRTISGYKATPFIGKPVVHSFQVPHVGGDAVQAQPFRFPVFLVRPFLLHPLFILLQSTRSEYFIHRHRRFFAAVKLHNGFKQMYVCTADHFLSFSSCSITVHM